jgi:hypothetical protein
MLLSNEPAPRTVATPLTAIGQFESFVEEDKTTGTAVWVPSTFSVNPSAVAATTVPVAASVAGGDGQIER